MSDSSLTAPADGPFAAGSNAAGFYYVALERSTGTVRGLYFDPNSSPFQELNLEVDHGSALSSSTNASGADAGSGSGGGGGSGSGVSFTSYSFA